MAHPATWGHHVSTLMEAEGNVVQTCVAVVITAIAGVNDGAGLPGNEAESGLNRAELW